MMPLFLTSENFQTERNFQNMWLCAAKLKKLFRIKYLFAAHGAAHGRHMAAHGRHMRWFWISCGAKLSSRILGRNHSLAAHSHIRHMVYALAGTNLPWFRRLFSLFLVSVSKKKEIVSLCFILLLDNCLCLCCCGFDSTLLWGANEFDFARGEILTELAK